MHADRIPHYTVEAYLERERDGDTRHEYLSGELVAMVGASEAHNLIAGNLHAALHTHLRNTRCRVFMSDMKVRIAAANHFFYPDLMVACGEATDPRNRYYRDDAILIIEVLSSSTAARDREYKRILYQQLPSLREYVLVSQQTPQVTVYRQRPGEWLVETCGPGDLVQLESVDLSLAVELIYEKTL